MNIISLFFCFLLLSSCGSKETNKIENSSFEKRTRLKLPTSVISFKGEEEASMNYLLYGRLELTDEQLNNFFKLNGILKSQLVGFDSLNFHAYKPKGDWWDYSVENKKEFYNKEWRNGRWDCSLSLAIQKLKNSHLLYVVYFEEP